MQKKEMAEEILKKYNQEQILEYLNSLENKEMDDFVEQILQIDFAEIFALYENTKKDKKEMSNEEITPIDYIDKEKINSKDMSKYIQIGEEIIKNNQYAVVTMAGGQGTRLGFSGPKGSYKLSNGKYIFEILSENIKKAKDRYGIFPYWYIMTSVQNNDQTVEFFKEHDFFGIDKEKVKFFEQGTLPMLTPEGKMIIEDGKIKTASNGNGGVYSSLKREKILEDMKKNNIKWVYISGVDNIMVNPIDPLLVELTIDNNMPIASKSVAKKYPEEKVGVFCKRDGKPSIVEYIELSENMRIECDNFGELVYGEANIVSHLLNLETIEKISTQKVDYHLEIKKGLYKFEAFVFDGFKFADDMLVMRVKREDEFAPIKNKEGVDSPETAVEIYEKKRI